MGEKEMWVGGSGEDSIFQIFNGSEEGYECVST